MKLLAAITTILALIAWLGEDNNNKPNKEDSSLVVNVVVPVETAKEEEDLIVNVKVKEEIPLQESKPQIELKSETPTIEIISEVVKVNKEEVKPILLSSPPEKSNDNSTITENSIEKTLLENHVKDMEALQSLRTLETAMKYATVTENRINFRSGAD